VANEGKKYALDIRKFTEKLGDKRDMFTQKLLIDFGTRVIQRTPVKSGKARNSWNITIGSPSLDGGREANTAGAAALTQLNAVAAKARGGMTFYFTNNLPYIRRLENGWSKQAPAGMVGVTVVEFQAMVDKAAREVSNV
jgi:hypothetical protein